MIPIIAIIIYFIAQAIIENKVFTEDYSYYHFFRLIELIALYVAILTFSNSFITLAGLFLIGDFIFEMLYNYLTYGYFDKEKQFKFLKYEFEVKPIYYLYELGIGIILIII